MHTPFIIRATFACLVPAVAAAGQPALTPASATVVLSARATDPPASAPAVPSDGAVEGARPAAEAPAAETPPPPPRPVPWRQWRAMTGEWGGLRPWLGTRGIEVGIEHVADLSAAPAGTAGPSVGRGLTVMEARVDLGSVLPRAGGWSATVQYMRMDGGSGQACLASAQGFSNIDTDPFNGAGEAWIEGWLVPGHVRVKAGRVDANSEFAAVDNGGEFINPSMGFSPTVFVLPTYPSPSASVNVFAETDHVYSATGLYNGRPAMGEAGVGAPFLIQEVGARWGHDRPGRAGGGAWRHAGWFDRPDGTTTHAAGGYAVLDQALWAGTNRAGAPATVGIFAQAGWADGAVADIARHLGLGVSTAGLIPGRALDRAGTALTLVVFGERCAAETPAGREMSVDSFYAVPVTDWLWLKSDVQVIVHAGGQAGERPAVVGTLRAHIVF
ncbi:MAG: carbohydrate porin [Vicinamibacterales bacterium]